MRKEIENAINVALTDGTLPPEALYADIYYKTQAQKVWNTVR